jgi:hypothetical protein
MRRYLVILSLCQIFASCKSRQEESELQSKGNSSSTQSKFLYDFDIDAAIGEEYRPKNDRALEKAEMQKLIDLFSNHFGIKYGSASARSKQSDQGVSGKALRGVHAKGHGCLIGTFEVLDHQVDDYKFGVFSKPKTYETVLRVSNGDGPPQSDLDRTISIGMAFKLRGVDEPKLLGDLQKETSVDFLMTNHPNFIVPDVTGFVQVIEGREQTLQKPGAVINAGKGLLQRKLVSKGDPLATPYWSNLPFKIGENSSKNAVKYLMRPASCANGVPPYEVDLSFFKGLDPDFLTKALEKHITANDACYNFYLQKQRDKTQSPIEDATVSWPEEASDLTLVGFLRVEKQLPNVKLARPNQAGKDVCQDLSFSPWNTTTDFQPLSSLNRARRVIYELSAETRRKLNGASNPEE